MSKATFTHEKNKEATFTSKSKEATFTHEKVRKLFYTPKCKKATFTNEKIKKATFYLVGRLTLVLYSE